MDLLMSSTGRGECYYVIQGFNFYLNINRYRPCLVVKFVVVSSCFSSWFTHQQISTSNCCWLSSSVVVTGVGTATVGIFLSFPVLLLVSLLNFGGGGMAIVLKPGFKNEYSFIPRVYRV